MKTSSIIKAFTCFIIFYLTVSASFAASVGKTTYIEGHVNVLKAGQHTARPLLLGEGVDVGDMIRAKSNSKAEITFINKNIMRIAPSTKVEIKEYMVEENQSTGIMRLYRGKVLIISSVDFVKRIAAFPGSYKLEVHTENTIAGIRGSSMVVFYERGTTGVLFLTGKGYAYNPLLPDIIVPITAGNIAFSQKNNEPPSAPRQASSAEMTLQAKVVAPSTQQESGSGVAENGSLPSSGQGSTNPPAINAEVNPGDADNDGEQTGDSGRHAGKRGRHHGYRAGKEYARGLGRTFLGFFTQNSHLQEPLPDSKGKHADWHGQQAKNDSHRIFGNSISQPIHQHGYDLEYHRTSFLSWRFAGENYSGQHEQDKIDGYGTQENHDSKAFNDSPRFKGNDFRSGSKTHGTTSDGKEQTRGDSIQEGHGSKWLLFSLFTNDMKKTDPGLAEKHTEAQAQGQSRRDNGFLDETGQKLKADSAPILPVSSTPLSPPVSAGSFASPAPAIPTATNPSFVSVAATTTAAITSVNMQAMQPAGAVSGKIDIPTASSPASAAGTSAAPAFNITAPASPAPMSTQTPSSFVSPATFAGATSVNLMSTMNLPSQISGNNRINTTITDKLVRHEQHLRERSPHHHQK